MIRNRSLSVALIAFGTLAAAASSADLAEVQEKLVEAQGKLKTYSTKFKHVHQISKVMKYEGEGVYDWMRDDGGIKYRREIKRKGVRDFDGEKMEVDENRTSLSDGKFLYSINNDTKLVMKQNFNPESFEAQDVYTVLGQLTIQFNEVTVLPEEKVGDYNCYVLECKNDAMGEEEEMDDPMIEVTREVWWFAKDFGMPVKIEGYDKSGKVVRSQVCSDIKVNPEFKADHFEFKAPEGGNVVDRTKE